MSRASNQNRKSATLTFQDFEKEWNTLEQLSKAGTPSQTNGTGSQAPVMKVRDQETAHVRPTVTQTDTGDGKQNSDLAELTHTPPVFTSRSENPKKLNFSSSVKSSDGPSNSPRKFDTSIESPRRGKISHREAEKNRSDESPMTIFVKREEEKSTAPNNLSVRKLKKEVSKKFTKLTLNLSGALEGLSPKRESAKNSPVSAGRVSPTKHSPRKTPRTWPAEFTNDVCNQATKIILKLKNEEGFKKCSPARQNLLVHAKLMEMLEQRNIPCDLKKLELLSNEVGKRSANAVIDVEIDLTKNPYLPWSQEFKKFVEEKFDLSTDRGSVYNNADDEEKKSMNLCFAPYFLRDFSGGSVKLECESGDGDIKEFISLKEFADFLNDGDPESDQAKSLGSPELGMEQGVFTRSRYITHFTSQNLTGFMGKLAFGLAPGLPVPVKLHDGTEIMPKGDVTIRYRFRKASDGGVEVKVLYEMKPDPGRESQTKDGRYFAIDSEANLTVSMDLDFSADRDLKTSPLRLHAEGWNLTVPDKFGKIG